MNGKSRDMDYKFAIKVLNSTKVVAPSMHGNPNRYGYQNQTFYDIARQMAIQALKEKYEKMPPCWVGDTIFFVCGYNMAEYTIKKVEYDGLFWQFRCENPEYAAEHRFFSFFDERIGKTVFLNRKDAELKFQEGRL